jgi:hypothetical protein
VKALFINGVAGVDEIQKEDPRLFIYLFVK